MPDERNHDPDPTVPSGWAEAFAALPQEAPPDDGWSRIAARLRSRRRTRWPVWVAMAAALAVAAMLPLKLPSPDTPAPVGDTAPPAREIVAMPVRDGAPEVGAVDAGGTPSTAAHGAGEEAAAGTPARVVANEPSPEVATSAQRPDAADSATRAAATATTGATASPPEPDSPGTEMQRLYAESAQLEALLAMARDDRVASGTAVALASDYDAQVGAIDAALMQPGITADERAALWHDRVAALRQAAAFESTRRMLAAQGERYDTMLVSID